ncbi:MAG TPA: hypothetical protein VGJ21_04725, partial [Terracidiphilus sp.]
SELRWGAEKKDWAFCGEDRSGLTGSGGQFFLLTLRARLCHTPAALPFRAVTPAKLAIAL